MEDRGKGEKRILSIRPSLTLLLSPTFRCRRRRRSVCPQNGGFVPFSSSSRLCECLQLVLFPASSSSSASRREQGRGPPAADARAHVLLRPRDLHRLRLPPPPQDRHYQRHHPLLSMSEAAFSLFCMLTALFKRGEPLKKKGGGYGDQGHTAAPSLLLPLPPQASLTGVEKGGWMTYGRICKKFNREGLLLLLHESTRGIVVCAWSFLSRKRL